MTTSRRDARRTPLRDWQRRHSVAWEALAQRTGLSVSTVMRAAAGRPVSAAAALALERVTGIAAATWLGSEVT